MAKSRGKGDGSIYPRCERKGAGHDEGDHRRCRVTAWVAQVELPRTADGRRRYARRVRPTRAEARSALREMQGDSEAGVVVDRTATVATWLEHWLSDVAPLTVTSGTVEAYRKVARNWITPYIGTVRLGDLRASHIASMLTALEADGRSPRTRQYALVVLRRALRHAEKTRVLPRNEASLVDGPKVSRRASDALTADEARKVLAAAKGERFEVVAVLAIKLGMRQGELLALRWDAVDLDAGVLRVDKGKTESSERTVPLANGTVDTLRAQKRRQAEDRLAAGPLWRHKGHVVTWEDGRPLSQRACLSWWHRLTERALGERRRFHASRHTCATLLLDSGVPLDTVSAILGHANLGITSSIYARPSADLRRRALEGLGDILASQDG